MVGGGWLGTEVRARFQTVWSGVVVSGSSQGGGSLRGGEAPPWPRGQVKFTLTFSCCVFMYNEVVVISRLFLI
jgi:hypothetical protein